MNAMPDSEKPEKLPLAISIPEAGKRIGIGRSSAYAAAAKGEIPTIRIGRRVLVPYDALLKKLAAASESEDA